MEYGIERKEGGGCVLCGVVETKVGGRKCNVENENDCHDS